MYWSLFGVMALSNVASTYEYNYTCPASARMQGIHSIEATQHLGAYRDTHGLE